MKKILSVILLSFIFVNYLNAQTGPGGVGDLSGHSSLQLWLRADTGVVFGHPNRVVKWLDQSGAGNNVSSQGSSNPTYITSATYPGIRFDGGQYLQAPASSSFFSPNVTVFIVKKREFSGAAISLASNGFSQEMLIMHKKIYHHHSSGNFADQGSACLNSMPGGAACIVTGKWGPGPTDIQIYSNGLLSTDPLDIHGVLAALVGINRKITIGQRDVFTTAEYLKGNIYEVIGYNVQLSDADRIAVENYLACKYSINNNICGVLEDCHGKGADNNKYASEEFINLYPNPASDELNIEFDESLAEENVIINVVNLVGQTVLSKEVSADQLYENLILPVGELNPGTYILVAKQEKKVITKRFEVQ